MDEFEKNAFEKVIANKTNLNFEAIQTQLLSVASTENSNVKSKVQAHIATLSADAKLFSPTDYYIFDNDSYTLGSRIWNSFVTKLALLRASVYFQVLNDGTVVATEQIQRINLPQEIGLESPGNLLAKTVELANTSKQLLPNAQGSTTISNLSKYWETVVELFLDRDEQIETNAINDLNSVLKKVDNHGNSVGYYLSTLLIKEDENTLYLFGNSDEDGDAIVGKLKKVAGLLEIIDYTETIRHLKYSVSQRCETKSRTEEEDTIWKQTSMYVAEEELNKCDFYTINYHHSVSINNDEVRNSIQKVQQFHLLKQCMQSDDRKHQLLQERMALRFRMNKKENSVLKIIGTVPFEFEAIEEEDTSFLLHRKTTEKKQAGNPRKTKYGTVPPDTFLSESTNYGLKTNPGDIANWNDIVHLRKKLTTTTYENFNEFKEDVLKAVAMSSNPESLSFPFQEPIVLNAFLTNAGSLIVPGDNDQTEKSSGLQQRQQELLSCFAPSDMKYNDDAKILPFVKWENHVKFIISRNSDSNQWNLPFSYPDSDSSSEEFQNSKSPVRFSLHLKQPVPGSVDPMNDLMDGVNGTSPPSEIPPNYKIFDMTRKHSGGWVSENTVPHQDSDEQRQLTDFKHTVSSFSPADVQSVEEQSVSKSNTSRSFFGRVKNLFGK